MSLMKYASGLAAFGAAVLTTSFLTLTSAGLLKSEDLRTNAYIDMVGVPTVCVGETKGVKLGDKYTRAECLKMLEKRIAEFDKELGRCIKVPLTETTRSALLQWAYNVGTPRACGSTVVKHLNAGRTAQACEGLMAWNKGTFPRPVKGESCTRKADVKYLCTIRGLTLRRSEERSMCLSGLSK